MNQADPIARAFDDLYARTVEPLTRQLLLLTGDRELTEQAVDHAYGRAWRHWSEIAVDPQPEGWLRTAGYDYALSPWQRRVLLDPWRGVRCGRRATANRPHQDAGTGRPPPPPDPDAGNPPAAAPTTATPPAGAPRTAPPPDGTPAATGSGPSAVSGNAPVSAAFPATAQTLAAADGGTTGDPAEDNGTAAGHAADRPADTDRVRTRLPRSPTDAVGATPGGTNGRPGTPPPDEMSPGGGRGAAHRPEEAARRASAARRTTSETAARVAVEAPSAAPSDPGTNRRHRPSRPRRPRRRPSRRAGCSPLDCPGGEHRPRAG
ncbi:hypothetical protein AQ490_08865 [Wenjunlia vitaminophila]|uniref:RNA polymerase sigma-70 region 2 domain-containing protein n=1 Tax=Wenjunlia vitaminophila TaxID=76728 RepID=A0A0T6LLZ2_WENVI|nr:hypothetical protein [Wenjunlia vitaminophila]KRV46882.1 hypothetical protein AQ490_08865 [Wenjunlia vitaminophila]